MQPHIRLTDLTPHVVFEALSCLGLSAQAALRDPVPAMRIAATVDAESGRRFLRLVLQGSLEWDALGSEDEARLVVAAVLAHVLARSRGVKRQGYAGREAVSF